MLYEDPQTSYPSDSDERILEVPTVRLYGEREGQDISMMKIFDVMSVTCLLAMGINFLVVFFLAVSNPPSYMALVTVNDYGEMWIEAVLFPLCLVAVVVTLIRLIRIAAKDKKNET